MLRSPGSASPAEVAQLSDHFWRTRIPRCCVPSRTAFPLGFVHLFVDGLFAHNIALEHVTSYLWGVLLFEVLSDKRGEVVEDLSLYILDLFWVHIAAAEVAERLLIYRRGLQLQKFGDQLLHDLSQTLQNLEHDFTELLLNEHLWPS